MAARPTRVRRRGRRLVRRAAVASLLLSIAAACRSTSVAYRFTPSPLEALVQEGQTGPILARVLVGVPGAEREGRKSDGYPLLIVNLRVENKADTALTFDPASTLLVGSDLAQFGPARAEPAGVTTVDPAGAANVQLRFPFPRDLRDLAAPLLTGVNLQFELGRAAGDVEVSVSLERNEPEVIYDPGPAFTFGPGYYYYGRW